MVASKYFIPVISAHYPLMVRVQLLYLLDDPVCPGEEL